MVIITQITLSFSCFIMKKRMKRMFTLNVMAGSMPALENLLNENRNRPRDTIVEELVKHGDVDSLGTLTDEIEAIISVKMPRK